MLIILGSEIVFWKRFLHKKIYIYTHIRIPTYKELALLQNALITIPKEWPCNANAKFDYYVLENNFSRRNRCLYLYIFLKNSFPTHDLRNCHCHLEKSSSYMKSSLAKHNLQLCHRRFKPTFLEWCLSHLTKDLIIYLYMMCCLSKIIQV